MARPKHARAAAGARGAAWSGIYHWHRPDFDNLAKACMDALKQIVFLDDGQIARALVEKLYGDRPGVEIFIREIDEKEEGRAPTKVIM